ncbi:MAG: glycosyltransferase [Acidobacteriaceae bacterium]|nr:glycosyltransferase [Acidobacteriaceae bacterium]
MKVLHVPYCYFPDAAGGTEVYVQALAREQQALGYEVEIAAPSAENSSYHYCGVLVRRFATAPKLTLRQLYGEGDPIAAETFENFALAGKPDVVHLHSFTSSVSTCVVRAIKRLQIPVAFTYHTPTVTCTRGTLLHFGERVCTGELSETECCACTLQAHGLPRGACGALSRVPRGLSRISGPLWGIVAPRVRTVIEMPELIELRIRAVQSLFEEVDCIVAVCDWIRDILILNGVPASKITLARQGLPNTSEVLVGEPPSCSEPLRLVFLGRLSKTKGIEMLANAVLSVPGEVRLDVYGVAQDAEGLRIRDALRQLAGKSPRIRLLPPLAPAEIVQALKNYHMLAVPSELLETGPLVVYEAFAAGLPVLGSDLGGIAELVKDGHSGILVRHNAMSEWVRTIKVLAENPSVVAGLAANVPKPRTMAQVAAEMADVYASIWKTASVSVQ